MSPDFYRALDQNPRKFRASKNSYLRSFNSAKLQSTTAFPLFRFFSLYSEMLILLFSSRLLFYRESHELYFHDHFLHFLSISARYKRPRISKSTPIHGSIELVTSIEAVSVFLHCFYRRTNFSRRSLTNPFFFLRCSRTRPARVTGPI